MTLAFLQSKGLSVDVAEEMRSRVIEKTMLNSLNLVDKGAPWHPLQILMSILNTLESCTTSRIIKPALDDVKLLGEASGGTTASTDQLNPCLRRVQMEAGAIYKAMRLAPFGQKILDHVGKMVGNLKAAELETKADGRMQILLTQTTDKAPLEAMETWITINHMLVVATPGHMGFGSFQTATSKMAGIIVDIKTDLQKNVDDTISAFLRETLSKEQVQFLLYELTGPLLLYKLTGPLKRYLKRSP